MKLNDLTRTELQNKKMWPMLRDIARQVKWQVNGAMTYMDADDWKDVLTAALRKNMRIAAGIDGGFVFMGMRTSKMTKDQMIELIESMYAFGAEKGVQWSEEERTAA